MITIGMPFRLWKGIDAAMDNTSQQAREAYWESGGEIGDPTNPDIGPIARVATGIREEGWRQFPNDSRSRNEQVDVLLTREQWEFIVAEARESLPVYAELAQRYDGQQQQDMLAAAELSRATITVVTGGLDAAEGDGQ
jgi:hypothetical protein